MRLAFAGLLAAFLSSLSCMPAPSPPGLPPAPPRDEVEPTDPGALITEAFVSDDGARAYLNVQKDGSSYSFVLDLRTGDVESRGGERHKYVTLQPTEGCFPALATHAAIVHSSDAGLDLVDCSSGTRRSLAMGRSDMSLASALREDLRVSSVVRAPGGGRAWRFGHRIEAEDPTGRIVPVAELPEGWRTVSAGGAVGFAPRTGVEGGADLGRAVYLELTGLTVLPAPPAVAEPSHLLALPHRWLHFERGDGETPGCWRTTGDLEVAAGALLGLSPRDRPVCAVSRDRVLVHRQPKAGSSAGPLVLVDLATGAFLSVLESDGSAALCDDLAPALPEGHLRGPDGRWVFVVGRDGRRTLASLDPKLGLLSTAAGEAWQLGRESPVPLRWDAPDELTLLVDRRRIARVRFGSDESEPLFPRG